MLCVYKNCILGERDRVEIEKLIMVKELKYMHILYFRKYELVTEENHLSKFMQQVSIKLLFLY